MDVRNVLFVLIFLVTASSKDGSDSSNDDEGSSSSTKEQTQDLTKIWIAGQNGSDETDDGSPDSSETNFDERPVRSGARIQPVRFANLVQLINHTAEEQPDLDYLADFLDDQERIAPILGPDFKFTSYRSSSDMLNDILNKCLRSGAVRDDSRLGGVVRKFVSRLRPERNEKEAEVFRSAQKAMMELASINLEFSLDAEEEGNDRSDDEE